MAEKLTKKGKSGAGIHKEVLKSLIDQCNGHKADMDEARGELGALVKRAEDQHGVHRKAFKLAITLNRMDEAARNDFLRALDDYRVKLGFGAQGDLFDDDAYSSDGDEADEGAEAARVAAENVARIEDGITQLN